MIINQEVLVQVTVTPEKLAELFCEMDSVEMAEFFSNVADEVKSWDYAFSCQMEAMVREKNLSDNARALMEIIGMYSKERR